MAENGDTQRLLGRLEEGQRAAQAQRADLFSRLDVVEEATAAHEERIAALTEKVAGIKGMPAVLYSKWPYVAVGVVALLLTGVLTWEELIQMMRGWVGAPSE